MARRPECENGVDVDPDTPHPFPLHKHMTTGCNSQPQSPLTLAWISDRASPSADSTVERSTSCWDYRGEWGHKKQGTSVTGYVQIIPVLP